MGRLFQDLVVALNAQELATAKGFQLDPEPRPLPDRLNSREKCV